MNDRPFAGPTLVVNRGELDGDDLWIEGDRYHHLIRARRLKKGEPVRLTDGAGRARWSRIEVVSSERARLVSGESAPANEASLALHLVVATPRSSRASWLVEKATELGVMSVCFFSSERTPRRLKPAAVERLGRVARAAVEQSHRAIVPHIEGGIDVEGLRARLLEAPFSVLLDPRAGQTLSVSAARAAGRDVLVAVGPEGGFAQDELVHLEDAATSSARLGPSILRIETAALAASSLLLFR